MSTEISFTHVKSIRWKREHFDTELCKVEEFPSINKAKAESRRLGGAGKVIAAKSHAHFNELCKQVRVSKEIK